MSTFKLPNISPLAGTTPTVFHRVLKGNRVALRSTLKLVVTYILIILGSLFRWRDRRFFEKRVNAFVFKESPLFIIGPWRSGTTYMHNLLTKDPLAGFVTTYHSVFPNNLKSKWIFKNFMRFFMPKTRPGDDLKIAVDFPQEDEYAMSNLTYFSFYHFFYFPSNYTTLYKRFVRFETITEEEEEKWKLLYRRMVTTALIDTRGHRAVLKNPVNSGRILKLDEIFPSANFIFMVRNPIIVYLSSVNFFTQLFPTLTLEISSPKKISAMVLDLYERLLRDYFHDKRKMSEQRLIEIRYEDFVRDPIGKVRAIYDKFGYSNFENIEPILAEYLKTQRAHKTTSHTIDERGLDDLVHRLDFAMKHWGYDIPSELEIYHEQKNQRTSEKPLVR